jgi:Leucine-rich repeat (LRR) protein
MQTDPPQADPPKRKRRWFQFSLRTLMIFTALVAVAAGRLGKHIEQKRMEQEAVDAIRKQGGVVLYDYAIRDAAGHNGKWELWGPAWLRNLLGEGFFSAARIAHFSFPHSISDAELGNLNRLTQLKSLRLCGTKVTDAGLASLNGLTQLEDLDLSGNNITAAGLQHLKGLSQLEWLDLSEMKITDAGLVNLRELAQLDFLDLGNTQVTDAGLANLKGLTRLKQVNLSGVRVTDAGIKDLQKALPNCEILR